MAMEVKPVIYSTISENGNFSQKPLALSEAQHTQIQEMHVAKRKEKPANIVKYVT